MACTPVLQCAAWSRLGLLKITLDVSGVSHATLVGMVLPDDQIEVKLQHVGMVSGRKIIKVEASNKETEEKVLLGEAEVEQPTSA